MLLPETCRTGAQWKVKILPFCGYLPIICGNTTQLRLRVSAVFMGEDSSSRDAERIYGKNLARIRGMDQLARAAGRLIQNEIRELGD